MTGVVFSCILTFLTPGLKAAVRGAITLVMVKAACERKEIELAAAGGAPANLAGCQLAAGVAAAKAAASGITALLPPGAANMVKQGVAGVAQAREVMSQVQEVAGKVQHGVANVQGMMGRAQGVVGQMKDGAAQVQGMVGQMKDGAAQVRGVVAQAQEGMVEQVKEGATLTQKHLASAASNALLTAVTHIQQPPHTVQQNTNRTLNEDPQAGGSRQSSQSLSAESKILGVVTMALIVGGAVKAAVDSLVRE